jgi:hypothetical protein
LLAADGPAYTAYRSASPRASNYFPFAETIEEEHRYFDIL